MARRSLGGTLMLMHSGEKRIFKRCRVRIKITMYMDLSDWIIALKRFLNSINMICLCKFMINVWH
jgi:hypothetical protein